MIVSDKTLKKMLKSRELTISSSEPLDIQPASVDIRLGNTFATLRKTDHLTPYVSLQDVIEYDFYKGEKFLIPPKGFALATTKEYFKLPNNLTAFVEGRSSIGRMGLFIQNAGWVDPGFEGEITLELFNASDTPILLEAGRRVGQLVFAHLDNFAENPYSGKYQKQTGATGSRIDEDKDI